MDRTSTKSLIGALIWVKDPDPITIRGSDGTSVPKVLWVHINKIRYAFSYDGLAVVMRRHSLQGPTVATFTNQTTPAAIKSLFARLARIVLI